MFSLRWDSTWVLRLRNTCAIGCAKKTAENVFNLFMKPEPVLNNEGKGSQGNNGSINGIRTPA